MLFSKKKKRGPNLPPPPQREHRVDPGKRRKLRFSERGMRHLPVPRLVVYGSSVSNSHLDLQKAQEQENQLRNQLKQNYMQIVSKSRAFSFLPS